MFRLIFLTIISINLSLQRSIFPRQVVQEVTLQCQREVTSKIYCFFLDAVQNNILEIVNISSFIRREMTDEEVKDATEVNLDTKSLTEYMPLDIGEHFPNLEALWVVKSKIVIIEKRNFDNMQNLKALNLYENKIEHFPSDVFMNLENLEFLDIDNNLIYELHPDLLTHQPNLLIFRSSFNRITYIPKGFFESNEKIERIYLNNNQITKVQVDFTKLNNLIVVDLEGNENGCDFSIGYFEDDEGDNNNSTEAIIDDFNDIVRLQYNVEKFCRP